MSRNQFRRPEEAGPCLPPRPQSVTIIASSVQAPCRSFRIIASLASYLSRAALLDHPCAAVPGGGWGASAAGPGEGSDAPQPPVPEGRAVVLPIRGPSTVLAGVACSCPRIARQLQLNAKTTVVHSGTGVGNGGPASLRCNRGWGGTKHTCENGRQWSDEV